MTKLLLTNYKKLFKWTIYRVEPAWARLAVSSGLYETVGCESLSVSKSIFTSGFLWEEEEGVIPSGGGGIIQGCYFVWNTSNPRVTEKGSWNVLSVTNVFSDSGSNVKQSGVM